MAQGIPKSMANEDIVTGIRNTREGRKLLSTLLILILI